MCSFQNRKIVTLDPNKFAEKNQKCLYIGGLQSLQPYVMLRKQSASESPFISKCIHYDMEFTKLQKRKFFNFPPCTKAFLYYFSPPEKPRIAGELRFRVISSDDPACFESGSDLLILNGQPWSRPLYAISASYKYLYEKLREDRLVPDDLDAVLSTYPPIQCRYRRRRHLFTLNDTFIIDFSARQHFSVITEQGVESLFLFRQFCEERPERLVPYTGAYTNNHLSIDDSNKSLGSALARFERSTLPEHRGTRTVVLRFLKIITPVQCVIPSYDGHIAQPKEGELHRKSKSKKKDHLNLQVWSIDIDADKKTVMGPALKLLWDVQV